MEAIGRAASRAIWPAVTDTRSSGALKEKVLRDTQVMAQCNILVHLVAT